MRKLCTIEKVIDIQPIDGADKIEVATIKGWQVVIGKGQFKIGDLVVYCEVDSLLPEREEFEFLRKSCWNPRFNGFRIKTCRLRGAISQGICFPLSILGAKSLNNHLTEGDDVGDIIGVRKYELPIPACLDGVAKGMRPSWIPKTDEPRCQNLFDDLLSEIGTKIYISEKIDGSSCSFYYKDGVFGVCGRNVDFLESKENSMWKVARELKLEDSLRSLGVNIVIQGEIFGEGIQGNKYKLSGPHFRAFDVFNIDTHQYRNFEQFKGLCMRLGIHTVPIVSQSVFSGDLNEYLNASKIKSLVSPDVNVWAEGIVVRSVKEKIVHKLGRFSFKSINPEFLLKHDE